MEFDLKVRLNNSMKVRFFLSLLVGIALFAAGVIAGSFMTSVSGPLQTVALFMFFLPMYMTIPTALYAGLVALICSYFAADIRKAVLTTAAIHGAGLTVVVLGAFGLIPLGSLIRF